MLDKTFSPKDVEGRIYALWQDSGAFRAGRRPDAEPFAIMIPPPNITGRLHIGHALNNTLQDMIARFERMRGKDVLWQPGTDHAGIATQLIVERQLAERQMSRIGLGREKFLAEIWKWKAESGGAITEQLRRLGASADWSRERFTMDEGLSRAVVKVFVELYRQGLIYKDKRLVNWDPRLQTAVSDLEVENIEIKGHLWHVRYPIEDMPGTFITVATTRPETMLGDTAVAVHPGDERYKKLVGRMAVLPLTGRLIPIIADEYSDPEKGTGAVKITPAHDFNDFEIGKRHKLPMINILSKDGTLTDDVPTPYRGLSREAARKKIVADLDAAGLLDRVEPIVHAVPHDEKTKTVVLEPLLTEQWYLNVDPLAAKAIAAVEKGETKFVPDNWTNVFFGWLRNIRPWCISRQLWWGHQIPVWYDADGKIYCAENEDEARAQAGGKELTRDPDVLDTWFSSALWPFSTLGWPDKTPELARFYPTSVLVTGFDIIFFWVARMMMMGTHFMPPASPGEPLKEAVPFRTVLIHNRVLDEQGAKMSKTKGNVVDPLVLIDEFGADALRFTLALAAGQNRDMRIGPTRVEAGRNFGTKLWNAARFCEMNSCVTVPGFDPATVKQTVNQWIVAETAEAAFNITVSLEALRSNEAADKAYHFVWDVFCDWYLEFAKPLFNNSDEEAKAETRATAAWARDQILKLLHPFMPFITEELWARTEPSRETLLIESAWTNGDPFFGNDRLAIPMSVIDATEEMRWVIDLIKGVRSVRSEMNVPAAAKIPLVIDGVLPKFVPWFEGNKGIITTMARLSDANIGEAPRYAAQFAVDGANVSLPLAGIIDLTKEQGRLEKELQKAKAEEARLRAKLSNERYIQNADEYVIWEEQKKLTEANSLVIRLGAALSRLLG
ncbi:MAG TPA: valine--tRNA ligase [Rhizomicrobium sp.]|nr:valine--tRNA ligase [Rhizomicrobium sp.]